MVRDRTVDIFYYTTFYICIPHSNNTVFIHLLIFISDVCDFFLY